MNLIEKSIKHIYERNTLYKSQLKFSINYVENEMKFLVCNSLLVGNNKMLSKMSIILRYPGGNT